MNPSGKRKVGLVLAKAPVYSETFLVSKIRNLMDDGFEVLIFTHSSKREDSFYKQVPAFSLPGHVLARALKMVYVIFLLMIKVPRHFKRFIQLERRQGSAWSRAMKNAFSSAHILLNPINHLHFEFVSLAPGVEMAAGAVGAKMSVSFRGFDISIYPIGKKNIYQRVWNKVDVIHTISDDLVLRAKEWGMPSTIPVTKIVPAISLDRFHLKTALGFIPENGIQIFSTGRLHWKKGYAVAFEALRILKEKGIQVHLTIAGDGDERVQLQYLIQKYGIHVTLAGKMPHDEIARRLQESHIYLQPSIQEGFCNSVLEAQAVGLPCVVSDAEGLSENVGPYGRVFPRRNAEALCQALIDLMQEPESERKIKLQKARKRVEEEFSLILQRQKFKEFFS